MNLASVCFTQLWLKKNNPQISLYTVPFISFCTTCLLSTGKQKWGNFKEQPTWHLQHWAIAQFETLPKHQASCFAIRRGGGKLSELVGHREKNGMAGIERRKRALVSFGAEQGLDHGRMAAATPEHPLPGASWEQGSLVFWRENAQGKYFWC